MVANGKVSGQMEDTFNPDINKIKNISEWPAGCIKDFSYPRILPPLSQLSSWVVS